MSAGIYKIINTTNGHCYIGSSNNVKKRFSVHKTLLKHNKHNNKYLQSAWNKYGASAFKFEFLWSVESVKECLLFEEQQLMNHINPEYNLSKIAMSNSKIGSSPPNKGKKASEETRRKISESNKGKFVPPRSEETKKLMSKNNGMKRRIESIDPNTGLCNEYESMTNACNGNRKQVSNLGRSIKLGIKAYGLYWRYI